MDLNQLMAATGIPLAQINDFQVHDFIEDPNFEQFIDLIRGENEEQVVNFDCQLSNGYTVENQLPHMPKELLDYNGTMGVISDPNLGFTALPSFNGGGGEDMDEEDSSGTTTATNTTTSKRQKKVDRSRTLISERRRRGRMKEKLYALRSLVPNITKMDKASIVGDAVQYVQELQSRARKLKAEIAGLEASLVGAERYQASAESQKKMAQNTLPISRQLMQLDVFQVEERGFYVKLVCNKGHGVAVSLYRALETLTSFNVQSSNLTTSSDRYVLTFTLHVKENEPDMNLPNLKLWVTGALLNQGFELRAPLSA